MSTSGGVGGCDGCEAWVGSGVVDSSEPGVRVGERPAAHDIDQGRGQFYYRAGCQGAHSAGSDRSSRRGWAGNPGVPS